MFKQNVETKKIVVQGKKGSYSIPVKALKAPQPPKQESFWKEYWT